MQQNKCRRCGFFPEPSFVHAYPLNNWHLSNVVLRNAYVNQCNCRTALVPVKYPMLLKLTIVNELLNKVHPLDTYEFRFIFINIAEEASRNEDLAQMLNYKEGILCKPAQNRSDQLLNVLVVRDLLELLSTHLGYSDYNQAWSAIKQGNWDSETEVRLRTIAATMISPNALFPSESTYSETGVQKIYIEMK